MPGSFAAHDTVLTNLRTPHSLGRPHPLPYLVGIGLVLARVRLLLRLTPNRQRVAILVHGFSQGEPVKDLVARHDKGANVRPRRLPAAVCHLVAKLENPNDLLPKYVVVLAQAAL